jgi:hypothetical protein
MDQSQNIRTQRENIERAMHKRALNDQLNPPQAPALVLSGFHNHGAAVQAQCPVRSVRPPTSSASAQTPRSNVRMHGFNRRGGSGRPSDERSQIAMQNRDKDNLFMANRSAMKRAKEAHKLTGAALNTERRVGKQELQKYRELGDLYVPPKSVSRSPVRGRRKKYVQSLHRQVRVNLRIRRRRCQTTNLTMKCPRD